MQDITNLAIPKGSTVLVVGANGFIASHVVNQLLRFGYRVRGTVRDPAKNAWLPVLFDNTYGKGNFELLAVPDLMRDGALDEAVKGASAVISVASLVSHDPDPTKVVPPAVQLIEKTLRSAYNEPSVKRFVLTSSSTTTIPWGPQGIAAGRDIRSDSWSEDALEIALAPPPYTIARAGPVYAASKIKQEQTMWKFFEENKEGRPDIVINSVLPAMTFGRSLDPVNQGHASSSELIEKLWKCEPIPTPFVAPRLFSDVEDVALLHVAATILHDVRGERLCAFSEPFHWDKVLAILRKQNPDHEFPTDFVSRECKNRIMTKPRAEEVLKIMGRERLTSLEESLRLNVEDLRQGS
ncbi:Aldehyde reductase 2 [Colletotrichum orbiculare MAFF 240422]|uniref:Aldehyde reductase 2 n=1 Tax=Colletotrichum orbiculare (strain 104-T / ATCC 96160 / CBS 514.97 / LARS 414 / MAFF 240422) TaxID=1213857 RepID=N4VK45_COLOR|nr:Aldehyde reductase 2 [Colletotrichum orbiculare MAFF 240422]